MPLTKPALFEPALEVVPATYFFSFFFLSFFLTRIVCVGDHLEHIEQYYMCPHTMYYMCAHTMIYSCPHYICVIFFLKKNPHTRWSPTETSACNMGLVQ
jgi:hypothetical protein